MKLEFCVACGSKDDLQHRHLVKNAKGGSDAEPNRITLCTSCHDKLHQRRYDAGKHSQRIKTAFAARRARGASIGRPKALIPDQCKEALQRLEFRRVAGCCGTELWRQQGYGLSHGAFRMPSSRGRSRDASD